MKTIFSGIQPSGVVHLGNYLGAIKHWTNFQIEDNETIFCIVDLHAITVPQEPQALRKNILSMAALYIACGVDPQKSTIFVQSSRPEHTELAWILNTIAKMGELSRMTQYKDKSQKEGDDFSSVGLFDYPVLMAADILLYGADKVPVGEDQKQHVELARDLAERFNSRFGQTFVVPEPIINPDSARIMGLDDPTKKMSKSANSSLNYIAITDDAETIRQKIKKAVTDSAGEIKSGADKPAITNLLRIFAAVTDKSVETLEREHEGKNYGEFKSDLSEAIIAHLEPIQDRYFQLIQDEAGLIKILENGAEKISTKAQTTIHNVKEKMGLGLK